LPAGQPTLNFFSFQKSGSSTQYRNEGRLKNSVHAMPTIYSKKEQSLFFRRRSQMKKSFVIAACIAVVSVLFLSQIGHADGVMDNLAREYHSKTGQWGQTLGVVARGLFWKLALIEFIWSCLWLLLDKGDLERFFVGMLRKIMAIMFCWAIIINFDTWVPAIIDSFSAAGAKASGITPLCQGNVGHFWPRN
jgi:hypothetical protein